MARKYTYHRENCNTCIRMSVVDMLGRTITLCGTHAFEWSIVLEADGRVTITTYKSGREARKEFNNLKKKR